MRKDGTEFPIFLSVSEVIEGNMHLFTGICRDLTEEVAKQKQAQAEEDCLPQLIWKCDTNGKAASLNKRFLQYAGVDQVDIPKINVFSAEVVHPEDHQKSLKAFTDANKTKTTFEVKRRIKAYDGTYKYMLTRASPIFNVDGTIQWWCGSCTDIDETERLQYELAVLPESLPQCIWKIDTRGEILYSNSRFQQFFGISADQKGFNLFSSSNIHSEDYSKSKAAFENAVKNKAIFETSCRLKNSKGTYNWFTTRGTPVLDGEGQLASFYGTCTDISEQKEQLQELTALPESLPQMVGRL